MGGIVAAVAMVVLAGWAVASGLGRGASTVTPTTAPARLDLPGRLIVLDTSTGRLATAAPDGSGFRPLDGPAYPANVAVASADGLRVVVGGFQVVDLGEAASPARPLLDAALDSLAVAEPWADRGHRLLLMAKPSGPVVGALFTVDADGRSRHGLGANAGSAAADPTRDGAVVAVQGDTEVNLGPSTQRNTIRIELRWWHGHHSVLATTGQLLTASGLPGDRPYVVRPVVSPDGRFVALTVDELTPNATSVTAKHAVVVTDRSGRVVTSRATSIAAGPAWSRDGTQLAWLDRRGVVLVRITGDHAATTSIPGQVGGGPCLFSPAGDHLLCDDRTTSERSIVTLSDGHVDRVAHDPARLAVAWLAAGGAAG